MSNYTDPLWLGQKDQKKRIKELELFREKQALPLLLACYNNLSTEEFTKVLRIISVITFRFTIIGALNPNLKETYYIRTANRISEKKLTSASAIAQEFKSLYTTDKDFKNSFLTKKVSVSFPYFRAIQKYNFQFNNSSNKSAGAL